MVDTSLRIAISAPRVDPTEAMAMPPLLFPSGEPATELREASLLWVGPPQRLGNQPRLQPERRAPGSMGERGAVEMKPVQARLMAISPV